MEFTMVYALIWFSVASLWSVWTLAIWVLHGLSTWAVGAAGGLSGIQAGTAAVPRPDWLGPWLPAEAWQAMVDLFHGVVPLINGLLQFLPSLDSGLTVVAWLVWGVGTATLLLLGGGLHLAKALWHRAGTTPSAPSNRPQLTH